MSPPAQSPIELQATDTPESAAGKVQSPHLSIILLLGDFDTRFQPRIRSILSRAVAPLALDSEALIIDNGATSGSATAMGLAASDQDQAPQMLAIVARNAKTWAPNHTMVMRLPAEWSDTAKASYQIAARLAKTPNEREKPVLAILSGGSDDDLPALIQCARRQWPILLMKGSGGLADQIVAAIPPPEAPKPDPPKPDVPKADSPKAEVAADAQQPNGATPDSPQPSANAAEGAQPGGSPLAANVDTPKVDGLTTADAMPASPKPGTPTPQPPKVDPIANPALAEIVETASLSQFAIDEPLDTLERMLIAHLEIRANTMQDAWARYDDLDGAAVLKQKSYKTIQAWILLLGVTATLLAISESDRALPEWLKGLFLFHLNPDQLKTLTFWIHISIILVPIVISILVTVNSRFREGNKWILLRSTAESIKREIFRYRARAGVYNNQQCDQVSRESRLAVKIKVITAAMIQSEVNKTSLARIPIDDPRRFKTFWSKVDDKKILEARKEGQKRLRFLSPKEYVVDRVEDQIRFMVKKTTTLNRQLKWNQGWIYVIGGLGTLLAAVNIDVWVALTTAVAAALTSRLESEQVENSLVQYNQALTSLQNIETWWKSLTPWEKERPANIDLLVETTEQTLEHELSGWVQQMQSALDKLTQKETSTQDNTQQEGKTKQEAQTPQETQTPQPPPTQQET
jgi:hypothetical protein